MIKRVVIALVVLYCSVCSLHLSADTKTSRQLKFLAPSTGIPLQNYYFTQVLSAALNSADTRYELTPIAGAMQQKRLMASLKSRQFDVLWTMTTRQREAQARPIRIPLTMGLFGYRQLIVKRDNQTTFDKLKSMQALKSFLCDDIGRT